jgi:recombination protein RecA
MGDSKMGLHARLMSQALRKLTGTISKTNCTVFFINQLRENWGNVQILKQLLVETH